MSRTRNIKIYSAADAQSPGVAAFMGLPEDAAGGYAGGDSTADAINMVQGTAESAYQTVDSMTATAHPLPAGVEPTVEVTGDMGAKVINVGIPESTTPPEPASFRALAPVRVALADNDVRVVAVGDSNTEGAGVSGRSDRWFEQVVASLRQRVPSGGDTGIGWVPAVSLGGPAGFSWTGGEETSDHVGGKGRILSDGAVGTFAAAGNVTVMWKGGSGGAFTVKIGSAAAQTINVTGSGTQQQTFTATGSNLVTVTGTSGEPVFYGAHFQTDAEGVHGWNLGQSGSRVDTWAYGDPQWGAPDSEVPAMQALRLIKPHLVVIALGANGLGGVFGEDYPPKQYATDMAALVQNVRLYVAAGGGTAPGFLLVTPSQLVDNMGTARDTYWLGFERELRRQFQGDALVSILHESDVWQPVSKTNPDPAGYLADSIHWSTAGMAAVGDYINSWLQRGFADAPEAVQAVATAQQAVAASQQSADAAAQVVDDYGNLVTLAQQAQAAAYNVPDVAMRDIINNPATETVAALDAHSRARETHVVPADYGVVGDGVAGDSANIMATANAAAADRQTLPLPDTYRINGNIALATDTLVIDGQSTGELLIDADGGVRVEPGRASVGTTAAIVPVGATTVTVTGAAWTADEHVGKWAIITDTTVNPANGSGTTHSRRVVTNTADTLTLDEQVGYEIPAGCTVEVATPLKSVTLRNVTLRRTTPGGPDLRISYVDEVILDNVTSIDAGTKASLRGNAVSIYHASRVRVTDCTVINPAVFGIFVYHCNDAKVDRCTVRESGGEFAIQIKDGRAGVISRCLVEDALSAAFNIKCSGLNEASDLSIEECVAIRPAVNGAELSSITNEGGLQGERFSAHVAVSDSAGSSVITITDAGTSAATTASWLLDRCDARRSATTGYSITAPGVTLTDCNASLCGYESVLVTADDVRMVGGELRDNCQTYTTGAARSSEIRGDGARLSITGTTFVRTTAGKAIRAYRDRATGTHTLLRDTVIRDTAGAYNFDYVLAATSKAVGMGTLDVFAGATTINKIDPTA